LNYQRLGVFVLVVEKSLAAHDAMLLAPFSDVSSRRPKDAFLLVFSSRAPICKGAPAAQHQRNIFSVFFAVYGQIRAFESASFPTPIEVSIGACAQIHMGTDGLSSHLFYNCSLADIGPID
jgi:hypothetical protein